MVFLKKNLKDYFFADKIVHTASNGLKIEDDILGLGTFDKSCRPCWFDHFDISHVLVAYKTREVVQCTCFKNLYHDTVPQLYHDTETLKRL